MPATEVTTTILREPMSAGTHLLWCAFSVFATALLWRLARGDRRRQFYASCFGLSMILLYAASGTYHSLRVQEPYLKYFRLLDHSAIYLLIAGTYTPICALVMVPPWRNAMLALEWALALTGIACKWLFAAPPYGVTVGLYIAMGWVGLVPLPILLRAVGWRGMKWVLGGGVLYTLGGLADACKWPTLIPGIITPHVVLHLCDMVATSMHVYFVARYVLPYNPALASNPALALGSFQSPGSFGVGPSASEGVLPESAKAGVVSRPTLEVS